MYTIRPAGSLDIDTLCKLDPLAQTDGHRREFIMRSVARGTCFVVELPDCQLAGYGVLDYSFYEQGFVSMLYICPAHRRLGAATELLCRLECQCRTSKLFTSTNLSNQPMQALLRKRGYCLSGVIHDLDEDDPELVYVKRLEANGNRRPLSVP